MAVDLDFFRSETSQRLRAQGHVQGHAEGRVEERAQTVLLLLRKRGVTISDDTRRRIIDCHDLEILGTWLDRAFTVTSAEELFADN